MKLLFIDANIFLNFYDFCDEDLDQLGLLVDLISEGKIKLILTTQICHEIKKNRENRLKDAYGKFVASKPTISMPVFCKHYDEYSDIHKVQRILDKLKSNLSKKLSGDIQEHRLKADLVIQQLMAKSTIIESDKYLEIARKRYQLSRPPGKKEKSVGDEINWEALLAEVTEDGEFIIISQDGDYANAVDNNQLKDYLKDEWDEKNPSEIFFYRSLSSFFKEHDIKIELRIEEEKSELVRELINSSSFLTTHDLVSKLGKYSSFSEDQIRGIATALVENNQVRWIVEDPDVKDFYEMYLLPKADLFTPDEWDNIKPILAAEEEEQEWKEAIAEVQEKIKKDEEDDPLDF